MYGDGKRVRVDYDTRKYRIVVFCEMETITCLIPVFQHMSRFVEFFPEMDSSRDSLTLQGLPITLTIAENDASGAYVERVIRPTYEDCCTFTSFFGIEKTMTNYCCLHRRHLAVPGTSRCDIWQRSCQVHPRGRCSRASHYRVGHGCHHSSLISL